MLSVQQKRSKRFIDLVFSFIGIIIAFVPLLLLVVISSVSTHSFGVFRHKRIGKDAIPFTMFKIKIMRKVSETQFKITVFGEFLHKTKLNELPQLLNVFIGDMSLVGPRPDIEGYADKLIDDDKIILSIRPGITGPATLKFANEENILSQKENPLEYNDTVLWPKKIELNKKYLNEWSLSNDFKYMYLTMLQFFR